MTAWSIQNGFNSPQEYLLKELYKVSVSFWTNYYCSNVRSIKVYKKFINSKFGLSYVL